MAARAKLLYTVITSLDGSTTDADGGLEWGAPDEKVFAFINDLERGVGTYLLGRRMYETMLFWEDYDVTGETDAVTDFVRKWDATDKVVYSRTLGAVTSRRTRLERSFDAEAVRRLKESADGDLSIGGADLASQALAAGLVDEVHLFVTPVITGGSTRALAATSPARLQLVDVRRFASGVLHLHYAPGN